VFIVGCFDQSPLSLACAVGGIKEVMMQALTEPEPVKALLERCIEYAAAYANALGVAGADLLSTGDSPAGLMGPDLYRELALPSERRVFSAIAAGCGVPASLHICGDATPLLADMSTSGAAVLEIDYKVDLDAACRIVPDDIALWGNLDPVALLQDGTPGQVAAAAEQALATVRSHRRTRFMLSSGCTLTPSTPAANVDALIAAAH
jgi:MtaA/CmuA family methyltransferase